MAAIATAATIPHVLEHGRQALSELDARMEEMQRQYADLQAQRSAWALILEKIDPMQLVPIGSPEDETLEVDPNADITAVARQLIHGTREQGFKPKEITARLVAMKLSVSDGFASNLVFRMKKKGEIVEHNKRYYLPKFDPKPRLNLSPAKDQGVTEVTP